MSSPDREQNEPMGARAMMQAFNICGSDEANVEVPTHRSLQIGSSADPGLIGGPSFLKGPSAGLAPPSGLGKPRLGLERPSRATRSLSKGSVGVQQEWDGCTTATSWNVCCEDLEKVPEDFPLERTHRLIQGVDAPQVASRISETLRMHSIEAEFNSKPPNAKCKTRDFVCFRIRLYAGSEQGDPVVVEVQRRKGPAACFMQACRAILSAAEGKLNEPVCSPKMSPMKPIGEMQCLQAVRSGEENVKETAQSALEDAKSMIRSKKRDTSVLGLENLCALTDPIKTSPAVSLHVAKAVALGLGGEDVRDDLVELTERDSFASASVSEDDVALINHVELLRQLSFTILSNSLSLCARDGCLSALNKQDWFEEFLVPSLLDEIKRVKTNSCNAALAATCVHSLACSSDSAKQFIREQGAFDVLLAAKDYGSKCNELLANETERCLEILA